MKKFLICFLFVYKMVLSDELLKMFLQCKFCYKTKLKAKKSKNSQKNTKHDANRKQTAKYSIQEYDANNKDSYIVPKI